MVSRFCAVTSNHVCIHKTEVDKELSGGTKGRKRKEVMARQEICSMYNLYLHEQNFNITK